MKKGSIICFILGALLLAAGIYNANDGMAVPLIVGGALLVVVAIVLLAKKKPPVDVQAYEAVTEEKALAYAEKMREMYDEAARSGDAEMLRYAAMESDVEFVQTRAAYYEMSTEVQSDYKVIYHSGQYNGEAARLFEGKALQVIEAAEYLAQKWRQYGQEQPRNCDAYKRLSMVYERQGRITEAAEICARAIKSGYDMDGTDGGMRGRLARLIKKGADVLHGQDAVSDAIEID